MGWQDRIPVVLYRGVTAPAAGTSEQAGPAANATITLYDSTQDKPAGHARARPTQFTRVTWNLLSSHDSAAGGVFIEESADGSQWDSVQTGTYPATYSAATGAAVYDIFISKPYFRLRYTNSNNSLTKWQVNVQGSTGDRAKAV